MFNIWVSIDSQNPEPYNCPSSSFTEFIGHTTLWFMCVCLVVPVQGSEAEVKNVILKENRSIIRGVVLLTCPTGVNHGKREVILMIHFHLLND